MTGRTSCAACGAANREGRKFCVIPEGAPLPLAPVCGSCGATNEPGERFCGECARTLDAGLAVAAHRPPRERTQVTVLFADVDLSIDLPARLDPEELAAVMGRLFALCARRR